jgi:hypothetical protein
MTNGSKWFPGLLGGLFIGVLSALPLVNLANCCCIWVIGGGALSAYLYQQNQDEPMTPVDGLAVGLLAGLVGAVVGLAISLPIQYLTLPMFQDVVSRMLETAEDVPPEVREIVEGMQLTAAGTLAGFFFGLFVNAIFAPVGGLLGAVISRKPAAPRVPPPLPPSGPAVAP